MVGIRSLFTGHPRNRQQMYLSCASIFVLALLVLAIVLDVFTNVRLYLSEKPKRLSPTMAPVTSTPVKPGLRRVAGYQNLSELWSGDSGLEASGGAVEDMSAQSTPLSSRKALEGAINPWKDRQRALNAALEAASPQNSVS